MDEQHELPRRDFHQLTLAVLAGLAAGLAKAGEATAGQVSRTPKRRSQMSKPQDESNPLLVEPHVCRGLNTCKGLGVDQQNACAGRGTCATAPRHECAGHNDCRGLGACYQGDPGKGHEPDFPGENTCKGRGACQVPLQIATDAKQRQIWEKARRRFKALMKDVEGVDIGSPPPLS